MEHGRADRSGDDAIHIANGKVVMRLKGLDRIDTAVPTPGDVGAIQSEGPEVPIRAIPAEFAGKEGPAGPV